jgi:hypothetical protein
MQVYRPIAALNIAFSAYQSNRTIQTIKIEAATSILAKLTD